MTNYTDEDEENLKECENCGSLNVIGEPLCGYCGEALMAADFPVYVHKKFSAAHEDIIGLANGFLADYQRDGFSVSLRQLYYQFVANVRGFPNTEASYKRLGSIINDARLAGRISFDSIEDRGRICEMPFTQPDPRAVLDGIKYYYAEDYWLDQPFYVEVWVEKDALSGVIQRPCDVLRVPYMACKGYMSASAMYESGERFKRAAQNGKECILVHLGDHDPSGIDMTRDNGKRLEMFSGADVHVERVGLNMDQIKRYNPPPNPTKVTDSRADDYIERFGHTCWELDALSPKVIGNLISSEVGRYIDQDLWEQTAAREREGRELLSKISRNRGAVFDFVRDL